MKKTAHSYTAIVLAAGKGVRMQSTLPKVLHLLRGKPLVVHVLDQLAQLKRHIKQIIVIVGYESKKVQQEIRAYYPQVEFITQTKQLGTAHAVNCARARIKEPGTLIVCGDAPLVTTETIAGLIKQHTAENASLTVLSARVPHENDLGRIIRGASGPVVAIKEKIEIGGSGIQAEVNSGMYACVTRELLRALAQVKPHPQKGEFFLTDIVGILHSTNCRISGYIASDWRQILGINNPLELAEAEKIMRLRCLARHMSSGVRIVDPDSTFIEEGVRIGKNTEIFPFTCIENNVIIGARCHLGPFIRVRAKTRIGDDVHLGNFQEINRCVIKSGAKAKHVCYLGDARIASKVNIGAGTIIANYDGKNKNITTVEQGAFIGCDSVLIAPVRIGKNAVTGAGSVVTKNVASNTIVVGVPARFFKKKG